MPNKSFHSWSIPTAQNLTTTTTTTTTM
jgi:hypothetical protein